MKFKFESNADAMDHRMVCYSLDKYLTLDAWSNIFEKLSKPIDRYVQNEAKMPARESLKMRRAQLDLSISWQQCDSLHLSMLGLEPERVYTYLMVVKVRAVSKVNEYLKANSTSTEHNDSTENDNLTHHNQSGEAKSLENTVESTVNETAPVDERDEPFNAVCLEEESTAGDNMENEGASMAGSLELMTKLPYQPRDESLIMDPTDFDENYCDDSYNAYAERQNAIIQSETAEVEILQESEDCASTSKRYAEHDEMLMYDGNEMKKKKRHNDEEKVETVKQDVVMDDAPLAEERLMWVIRWTPAVSWLKISAGYPMTNLYLLQPTWTMTNTYRYISQDMSPAGPMSPWYHWYLELLLHGSYGQVTYSGIYNGTYLS